MTWRDQYEAGSFRGAAFRTEGHERSGGRRVATHEFPGRDEPVTEDLGRRARSFSIDCHVIGEDYRADRDALLDALEEKDAGLLIHPWHGQMMVVVLDFTSSEDQAGGVCTFSIEFGESGQPVSAPVATPTGQAAGIEADTQMAAAPDLFADRFSIDGAAGFVEQSANDLISGMVEISQIAAGLQGGSGSALRAFDAGLRFLPANLSGLLRAPVNLAHAVLGLVGAVALLGSGPRSRIAPLTRLTEWEPVVPAVAVMTPSRQREADNRDALLWVFRTAACGELVRAAAASNFTSYDDAVAVRDAITARLDVLALQAADRGDDTASDGFDALRRAVVRDVAARSPMLARIYTAELAQTEPALAVANRLYGAAGVEERAAEIVDLNHVAHPGFVPGGQPLSFLTEGGAG